MKQYISDGVRYLLLIGIGLNLFAIFFDLIDRRSFSLILLLLAAISQLWHAWDEYNDEKKLAGRVLISLVIGLGSLILFISSFF